MFKVVPPPPLPNIANCVLMHHSDGEFAAAADRIRTHPCTPPYSLLPAAIRRPEVLIG